MDAVATADYVQLGEFEYQSNPWNSGALAEGQSFSQALDLSDGSRIRMVWQWPDDTYNVMSYPSIIWGQKPWSTTSTTLSLPRPIDSLDSLTVRYDLDWTPKPRGNFNVSFDIWIANTTSETPNSRVSEVMVWVKNWDWAADETAVAHLTDATGSAAVYHHPNHGGADGWNYVAVLYDEDHKSGTLDVTGLLAQLAEEGLIDRSDYLMDIEIGNEIVSGAAWLDVLRYEIAIDGVTVATLANPGPNGPTAQGP